MTTHGAMLHQETARELCSVHNAGIPDRRLATIELPIVRANNLKMGFGNRAE
jgi:hypothetical protein